MFVIVMKSKVTGETFKAYRTVSGQPCRLSDIATAERLAHEMNANLNPYWKEDGAEWIVKEDDGIYFQLHVPTEFLLKDTV